MEKNERLAWEQSLGHIAGAFPAAQSAVAMGDPSNWRIKKNTFSGPEKFFFFFFFFLIFPSRHPWEQAVSFSGAFPAAQSAVAMGDPSNWRIKKNFSGPEKLFFLFYFPLLTPLRAGSELFRCFSSCPKRSCNGRPFQLAKKKNFSGPEKFFFFFFFFWFSPPENF